MLTNQPLLQKEGTKSISNIKYSSLPSSISKIHKILSEGLKKTIDPITHPQECAEGKPEKGMPEFVTIEEIIPREKLVEYPSDTKIKVETRVKAITSQKSAKTSWR